MIRWIGSLSLLLAACASSHKAQNVPAPPSMIVDGKWFASFYQQRAAEYKALCFQAYHLARVNLDNYRPTSSKPLAIITDIDETVLDNSPYAVEQARAGKDYEGKSWAEWTSQGSADTLAGAASFFNYAASKKVEIFYITNRNENERTGTLANLKKYGLPWADDTHLILRSSVSSKEARRQEVMNKYEVVLLIGDNLADFASNFDKRSEADRDRETRALAAQFGTRFIVLPNPVYGDWEQASFQYLPLNGQQKDSAIRAVTKGYK